MASRASVALEYDVGTTVNSKAVVLYFVSLQLSCGYIMSTNLVHNNTILDRQILGACVEAIGVVACRQSVTVRVGLVAEGCKTVY